MSIDPISAGSDVTGLPTTIVITREGLVLVKGGDEPSGRRSVASTSWSLVEIWLFGII